MLLSPLPCRTSHSRAKAEAAVTAAQKAQEEARIARITAKEFSPSFQHRENGQSLPGPALAALPAPQNPQIALDGGSACARSSRSTPELLEGESSMEHQVLGDLGQGCQYPTVPPWSGLVAWYFLFSPNFLVQSLWWLHRKSPTRALDANTDDPSGHH